MTEQLVAKLLGKNVPEFLIARSSKHSALAQEICSAVSATITDAAMVSVPKNLKHLVQSEIISIDKKELLQLIDDVGDETLAAKRRAGAPCQYTISLAEPIAGNETKITVEVVKYTLPIAYKILGVMRDSPDPLFAACLVWEKHCVAFLKGRLCADSTGNYGQRESALKHALQTMNAADAKYPLALADFLCQCALAERKETATTAATAAPELRALLLADEIDSAQLVQ